MIAGTYTPRACFLFQCSTIFTSDHSIAAFPTCGVEPYCSVGVEASAGSRVETLDEQLERMWSDGFAHPERPAEVEPVRHVGVYVAVPPDKYGRPYPREFAPCRIWCE